MTKKKLTLPDVLPLVFLLSLFLLFLLRGSTLPFVGNNAWNFNTYSLIAHNYIAFGFINTLAAPIISVTEAQPLSPTYYLHHPQLLSILQALFFYIFEESFFTARLPVIIASFLSVLMFPLIGKQLLGKTFGIVCLAVATFLPGFVVFGRMIGQEPIVLFFVLLTIYASLRYYKTKKKRYLFLSGLSTFFGTLSDWPMVYFILLLFPFLTTLKLRKLYFVLVIISFTSSCLFLLYSMWFTGGSQDLITAFLVRGPGAVFNNSQWFFVWPTTILLRILIYFSPLVVVAGLIGLVKLIKERNKKLVAFLVSCGLFGVFHIALYPEGSFGHAYWIYYLLPFFVFSSAYFVIGVRQRKVIVMCFFTLLLFYFLLVEQWKYKEMEGNMFRYYFAQAVASNLKPYDSIRLETNGIFDADMFEYQFHLPTQLDSDLSQRSAQAVIYSCYTRCPSQIRQAIYSRESSSVRRIYSHEAEAYVVKSITKQDTYSETQLMYTSSNTEVSVFKKVFILLKQYLAFPQL